MMVFLSSADALAAREVRPSRQERWRCGRHPQSIGFSVEIGEELVSRQNIAAMPADDGLSD